MGKKGELIKQRCINAALDIINGDGVEKLTIRNILSKTSLLNGSLYKQFKNLDEIIYHVNSYTLRQIKSLLEDSISKGENAGMSKDKVLCIIASEFIKFAEHKNDYWRLLFEKEMMNNNDVPTWVLKEVGDVFIVLVDYLADEDGDIEKAKSFVAILWSSLCGLVNLSHKGKLQMVTNKDPKELVDILIMQIYPSV